MTTPKHQKARDRATNNPSVAPRRIAQGIERALLVQLRLSSKSGQEDLEEFQLLAESAGAQVCGTILGGRQKPDAATFVGKGKAREICDLAMRERADLVLVNHPLSPTQERNLEKIIGCRVLDRTGLILDIFAQHARSHEGKLQVELAQLEHLSTRLVRGWTHLERQKGGIGLRGPGETQLEVDRRLIRDRIKRLNRRLHQVSIQRRSRRKARLKVPIPTVSMVGYTNAGKSSLFNRLTGASVYAADHLFATLDPTMRRVVLPGATAIIMADTVGFIRHLPHDLVEAFKSTLEEVAAADLLLHVVDSSSPERLEQIEQVNGVLEEIFAAEVPQIVVFNKIDLSGQPAHVKRDAAGRIAKVWVSAKTGEGLDLLLDAISEYYRLQRSHRQLRLPPEAGRLRAGLYERLDIVRESALESGGWLIDVALEPPQLNWLRQQEGFREEYLLPDAQVVLALTGS